MISASGECSAPPRAPEPYSVRLLAFLCLPSRFLNVGGMTTNSLFDLFKLTPAERIQLAQDLWDSIPEESELPTLSEEQKQELERRLAAHDQDPSSAVSHEEVRARLRARFGA
jgi:putative addiction module component (TIGR02574 family)